MDFETETFVVNADDGAVYEEGDVTAPLTTGTDPSANILAFSCKDHGADTAEELAPTMRSMPHHGSHANAGGQLAVAFNLRGREGGAQPEVSDVASLRAASGGSSRSYAATEYAVRRLTVRECEILQGFPSGYTAIQYGRPRKIDPDEAAYLTHHGIHCWQEEVTVELEDDGGVMSTSIIDQWFTDTAADGPCYRALGNSWAVPVVRRFFARIDALHKAKHSQSTVSQ